jgi:hypothetical protein
VLKALVHSASIYDRDGGRLLLEALPKLHEQFPRLRHLWVDVAYQGRFVEWVQQTFGWSVKVVKHWWTGVSKVWVFPGQEVPEIPAGFQLLKWRWIVEIVHPQMTKPDGGTVAGGGEDVADLDIVVGDNDAINEEFDERSSLVEGRRMQTHPHLRTEVLQRLGDCAEGDLLLCPGIELPLLILQRLLPPRELAVLLLKGWQGQDAGEIGIEQAVLGRVQLGQGMVQSCLPSLELLGEPLPAMGPS